MGLFMPSVFSREFYSSNIPIVVAGLITIPHGLGVVPKMVTLELICLNADQGYVTGDIIQYNVGLSSLGGGDRGFTIFKDAININVGVVNQSNPIAVLNKTTRNAVNVTSIANWNYRVGAFT